MDSSGNMESLDESVVLPELSFDDLLDPSPVKKSNKSNIDDDALELENECKNRADDTLNTPGPKKPPIIQKSTSTSIAIASGSKTTTPVRTQAVKLGTCPTILTNAMKNNNGTSTPVLLNTKNILPKTSAQISNSSIKLTPKTMGSNTSSSNISISGKTAVRTSNGQIIYIQKTPSSNIKTTASSNTAKPQIQGPSNSKPMTIQVLRTADGTYVPIKNASRGANGKNATVTLPPTSLTGKKISSGGQLIIKGTIKSTDSTTVASVAKTITTNTTSGVRTVVKTTTSSSMKNDQSKPKPIVVHGKQIIVSNQNIVKLSPKSQTITTTAGGNSVTTSSSGAGQIHTTQIPGKIGVQYVRVLPNTKIPVKLLNAAATSCTTSTTIAAVTTKPLNTSNQQVKILNSLPQKFTVVQKGGTTKLLVTQKKDTSNSSSGEYSPLPSKVQKTIVAVPTIKSLNDDKLKNQSQQQSLIKSTQHSLLTSNSSSNQSLIRKHKISEINSEIQRITTSADNSGPPEIKKLTPNNRVVVISNNSQPKILNNNLQQTGRITATITIPTHTLNNTTSNASASTTQVSNSTQNSNKLYTILKPASYDQKPNHKLYSVLKTNNQSSSATTSTSASTSATSTASPSSDAVKPTNNKPNLIQQQHKQMQQKQQNTPSQNVNSSNTRTISSSKFVVPVKIKEEPMDIISNTKTAHTSSGGNTELTSTTVNALVGTTDESESLDPLVGGVRRKHCNCSKSQCLKLYCDCFANGEFCQDCTCKDCFNNLENEDERQRAIRSCLERNPNAFKPKITSSRDQADMRLHNKGCNCKRSGCLKNYCECYEAKIPCSSNCKCVGCRNVEDRPDLDMDPIDPKIMASIAMASVGTTAGTHKRSYEKSQRDLCSSMQGITIKTEKNSKDGVKPFNNMEPMSGIISPSLERQQCNFITQEVIDATIQCMITQADECEKNGLPPYQMEKMVMEELGRCLVEIIDFSIRNTENSYSQD